MNYLEWIECLHKSESIDKNVVNNSYAEMRKLWNTDSGKTYHSYMDRLRRELEEQKRWKIKKTQ